MRVILTAVPGCGKTTIVEHLKKRMKINFVNFGDIMFEMVRQKLDRDEMRKQLSDEEYRELQLKAAEKIKDVDSIIIDTHSSVKTARGFYPGCPEKVIKTLKPDLFIIIEKSPEEIAALRATDKKRNRDSETPEEIEEHQMMNRYYAAVYSVLAGCPVAIINLRYKEKKPYEHAEDAAEQIAKLLGGEKCLALSSKTR